MSHRTHRGLSLEAFSHALILNINGINAILDQVPLLLVEGACFLHLVVFEYHSAQVGVSVRLPPRFLQEDAHAVDVVVEIYLVQYLVRPVPVQENFPLIRMPYIS